MYAYMYVCIYDTVYVRRRDGGREGRKGDKRREKEKKREGGYRVQVKCRCVRISVIICCRCFIRFFFLNNSRYLHSLLHCSSQDHECRHHPPPNTGILVLEYLRTISSVFRSYHIEEGMFFFRSKHLDVFGRYKKKKRLNPPPNPIFI